MGYRRGKGGHSAGQTCIWPDISRARQARVRVRRGARWFGLWQDGAYCAGMAPRTYSVGSIVRRALVGGRRVAFGGILCALAMALARFVGILGICMGRCAMLVRFVSAVTHPRCIGRRAVSAHVCPKTQKYKNMVIVS